MDPKFQFPGSTDGWELHNLKVVDNMIDHTQDGLYTSDRELLIRRQMSEIHWKLKTSKSTYSKTLINNNIDPNNPEADLEAVYQLALKRQSPFVENYIIPKSEWNLQSLCGETEIQLYHPHYRRVLEYVFKNCVREHDILTILECSNKKPYKDAKQLSRWHKLYSGYSDFASISNPGVIPYEFSNQYPFRFDEWFHFVETEDIMEQYNAAMIERVFEYKERMGYKYVITAVHGLSPSDWIRQALKNNTHNCREWLIDVFSDDFRSELEEKYMPVFKNKGVFRSRIINLKEPHERYREIIKTCTSNLTSGQE